MVLDCFRFPSLRMRAAIPFLRSVPFVLRSHLFRRPCTALGCATGPGGLMIACVAAVTASGFTVSRGPLPQSGACGFCSVGPKPRVESLLIRFCLSTVGLSVERLRYENRSFLQWPARRLHKPLSSPSRRSFRARTVVHRRSFPRVIPNAHVRRN